LDWLDDLVRAKRPMVLPVSMTRDEFARRSLEVDGHAAVDGFVAVRIGAPPAGVRESPSLRVKDIDFGGWQLVVRRAKGQKDRAALLPSSLESALNANLAHVKNQQERDLSSGAAPSSCPMRSRRSIRRLAANGRGDGFSRYPTVSA
jgi:hypothetical protein